MYKIPQEFQKNMFDVLGGEAQGWLQQLPSCVEQMERKWGVELVEVFSHLTYSFVAVVRLPSGEEGILKIAPPHPRTQCEIAWFSLQQQGTPRLLQSDAARGALLMERIKPGYSAKKYVQEGHDDEATRALAQVIRSLRPVSHFQFPFPHVRTLLQSLKELEGHVEARLLARAQGLLSELTQDTTRDVVLHGDLHHNNILFAGDHWVAIDPHGYVGPAAFEVGAMVRNPYDCFPTHAPLQKIIERRLDILCEELPFLPQEIYAWSSIYTLVAAGWSWSDHGEIPKEHIQIAEILFRRQE